MNNTFYQWMTGTKTSIKQEEGKVEEKKRKTPGRSSEPDAEREPESTRANPRAEHWEPPGARRRNREREGRPEEHNASV